MLSLFLTLLLPFSFSPNNVSIVQTPQYPKPGESVVLKLEGLKSKADIIWAVDENIIPEYNNKKQIMIDATSTTVKVFVKTDQSTPFVLERKIIPITHIFVNQPISWGRALSSVSFLSPQKTRVISYTKEFDPKDLYFTWYVNDSLVKKGLGENQIETDEEGIVVLVIRKGEEIIFKGGTRVKKLLKPEVVFENLDTSNILKESVSLDNLLNIVARMLFRPTKEFDCSFYISDKKVSDSNIIHLKKENLSSDFILSAVCVSSKYKVEGKIKVLP